MADLTIKGFELADKYRMTSMILADGTMGQMMEPVALEERATKTFEKPWATNGTDMKRPKNVINSLYLDPGELEKVNFQRFEKYKTIEENEVMYEEFMMDDAEICIVAFGLSSRISKNAIIAAREKASKSA